ncbi:glycerate kinase [Kitasatospora sp. NPDC058190]|uniref:glycerate kinase n=1 Tax=Kitasatospora sp. NPDC058190 TaxID=3346371 RepID=UPI0036D9B5CA
MRIVLAPDSFKGTVAATEAARALAEGRRSVRPDDQPLIRPMADGGEGPSPPSRRPTREPPRPPCVRSDGVSLEGRTGRQWPLARSTGGWPRDVGHPRRRRPSSRPEAEGNVR